MSKTKGLIDLLAYICATYPERRRGDLSNARVTKLVYLADWVSVLREHGRTLTGIRWVFNRYGPWVDDVMKCAQSDESPIEVVKTRNMFGSPKTTLVFNGDTRKAVDALDSDTQLVVDSVVSATADMTYLDFINYVYETYPIVHGRRGHRLDLTRMAQAARKQAADKGENPLRLVDFKQAGLDAYHWARVRDAVDIEAQRQLRNKGCEILGTMMRETFDMPWSGGDAPTKAWISHVVIDPIIDVLRVGQSGYAVSADARVRLVAVYYMDGDESDRSDEASLSVRLLFQVEGSGDNWTASLAMIANPRWIDRAHARPKP